MFDVKIIADSINAITGDRITTMKVVFPRMVLAEFNTHRAFTRNSASSRAIPFKKMVKMVKENPFIPIAWQKDHKGMQGSEYLSKEGEISEVNMATSNWLSARDAAITWAESLNSDENGYPSVTKQLCNRLLEPFMWHTVLCTATDFENFFALRCHPHADIHIAKIAEMMLEAYNTSTPQKLGMGEWHVPFGDRLDKKEVDKFAWITNKERNLSPLQTELAIATARCARISYETLGDNPKIDFDADIRLHDSLVKGGHWSPFEHCAFATNFSKQPESNFKGWIQYRKKFNNENRKDNRVIKHKINE